MMDLLIALPLFFIGVLFLYKGSDMLVDGTSHTAAQLGVSSLIISVVIVAFGTSTPEFAISVGAAIQKHADISAGNILGSCIANLLLVLGLSAVIQPIKIQMKIIRREMPIVTLTTLILLVFSISGLLDEYHIIGGILFIILFSLFLIYFVRCAKQERNSLLESSFEGDSILKNIIFIILGLIGVILGAWILIKSAIIMAEVFHISPFIISLSMVAVGTSLPELVVSTMAAYKKEADIAVGNVLGSNVFNIFLILGASAIFIPLNMREALDHLVILMAVTIVAFIVLYTGNIISRLEGLVFLVIYAMFVWYIFL
ncbi:MAG: sodium:calcium antiporter [Thermoplasmata archaeon]|nr:MAG: sodium:calcium antiporter [Thermoplasmata archaeon]